MDSEQIINRLGGTFRAAELCEVTPAAVSQWRKGVIPAARLMFLKLARPEIFAAEGEGASPVQQGQVSE